MLRDLRRGVIMIAITELLTPETIIRGARGEYKIIGMIGRGGMGAVYRAQRLADGTIWALKEMRPQQDAPPEEAAENRRLFEQEAALLEQLRHPNLPVVADRFDYQGRPVLVMEFVPGQTLEDRIRETNATLLEQQVLGYGIQVARVLHYLHSLTPPVIYRDLKPSNIMITPDGVLKVIDFGVARTHKRGKSKDTVAMGSAGYALGATLLHLLTNMPPIPLQTPSPGGIRKFNLSVDQQTEDVIIKAMAADQAARFQTAAEFEQALLGRLDTPYIDPTVRVVPPPIAPAAPTVPVAQFPSQGVTTIAGPPPQIASHVAPVIAPPPIADGVACNRCGRVNKAGARFCAGCGTPIGPPPVARLLITTPRGKWEQKIDRMPLRIGRRDPRQNHYPELDLAEHDRGIASRNHAVINRDGDYYTVTDLGSTNGTLLNEALLLPRAPQRLRPGDRIKIGEVEMEFRGS